MTGNPVTGCAECGHPRLAHAPNPVDISGAYCRAAYCDCAEYEDGITVPQKAPETGTTAPQCSCKNHPVRPHPVGEPPCAWSPLLTAVDRSAGWCDEHDEREPCQICGVRRAINSARDHIPTVGYDHSLCGADPCSDCR